MTTNKAQKEREKAKFKVCMFIFISTNKIQAVEQLFT